MLSVLPRTSWLQHVVLSDHKRHDRKDWAGSNSEKMKSDILDGLLLFLGLHDLAKEKGLFAQGVQSL